MPVRARRAGIVAGLIVGLYAMALANDRGVPDAAVALLGGPTGVERHGGLRLRYRLPADVDVTGFQAAFEQRGGSVLRDGTLFTVELLGVAPAEAERVAAIVTGGGLTFHQVIEDVSLRDVAAEKRGIDQIVAPGVTREADLWHDEVGGHTRTAIYLLFGPYVPIDVHVPAASADEAHRKISAVFQDLPVGDVFA